MTSSAEVIELGKVIASNPMLSTLVALALNQTAYKAGLWNPRSTPNGPKEFQFISIDSGGVSILRNTSIDPDEIASRTATTIGAFLMAAGLVYAAKAPLIQPVIGVRAQ